MERTCSCWRRCLFDFLFQTTEQLGIKELLNGNAQSVAQLFDGRNCRAVIATADNVIDRRLGDTTHAAQLIDGDIVLTAQLQNPFFDGFSYVHGYHLSSR